MTDPNATFMIHGSCFCLSEICTPLHAFPNF